MRQRGYTPSFALVLALLALHGFYFRWVGELGRDQRRHGHRFYRRMNEVPVILMIGIVILVMVKPF